MGILKSILMNTSYLFFSDLVSKIFGFIYITYAARYLGADGFGIISFSLALAGIFSFCIDLGLSTLMIREISKNRALKDLFFRNVMMLKLISSPIVFFIILAITHILDYPINISLVIYIITLSTIINSFSLTITSVFQAFEEMKYISINNIINSLMLLIFSVIAIKQNMDVIGFSIVYLVVSLVILSVNLCIYTFKFSRPDIELKKSFLVSSIQESLPFAITGLSGMIYTYADTIILSIQKGNEVVGWYSAAYKLILITLFIPGILNIIIFPLLSRLNSVSRDSLLKVSSTYFEIMLIIAIPMGFGTTLLADKIILFVFGPGYERSVIALQILIWTMVLTFSGASFVKLLEVTGKQAIVTKLSVMCIFINIALNMALIPNLSYVGSSIATVLTELFFILNIFLCSYKLRYLINTKRILLIISKILLINLIMMFFIIEFNTLNLIILISGAALIYLICIYTLGLIKTREYRNLEEIL